MATLAQSGGDLLPPGAGERRRVALNRLPAARSKRSASEKTPSGRLKPSRRTHKRCQLRARWHARLSTDVGVHLAPMLGGRGGASPGPAFSVGGSCTSKAKCQIGRSAPLVKPGATMPGASRDAWWGGGACLRVQGLDPDLQAPPPAPPNARVHPLADSKARVSNSHGVVVAGREAAASRPSHCAGGQHAAGAQASAWGALALAHRARYLFICQGGLEARARMIPARRTQLYKLRTPEPRLMRHARWCAGDAETPTRPEARPAGGITLVQHMQYVP